MRFYTFVACNGKRTVLVSYDGGSSFYSVNDLGFKAGCMNSFIKEVGVDGLIDVKNKQDSLPDKPFDTENGRFLAAIPNPEQDIICLGVNYFDHGVEGGHFDPNNPISKPEFAVYFGKHASNVSTDGDTIPSYPELVNGTLDYEVELAVVIGKDAKKVEAEDFADYVFGYALFNDISARNVQRRQGGQWFLGKSLDGHAIMGPCIVTADELGDPADLDLKSYVNGEVRQNSNTSLMMTSIGDAIKELSVGMTLKAGSIISTGTPAGVGHGFKPPRFLKPGDVLRTEIEKIGYMENVII